MVRQVAANGDMTESARPAAPRIGYVLEARSAATAGRFTHNREVVGYQPVRISR
jgi:hypothetical protein